MPPPHRLRTRAVSGLTPPCCYTQIRALSYLAEASESEQSESELSLNDRCIRNVTDFFGGHLGSKGTRHAENQNVHDALLTAVVDGKMKEDRLILAVSKLFGAGWRAVEAAVLRRVKLDDECIERTHGALAEAGMLPRTVSIVMSDNGGDPSAGGFNLPFRGTKATLFEVSCCVVVVVAAAATLQVTAYRTPLMHLCSTLR